MFGIYQRVIEPTEVVLNARLGVIATTMSFIRKQELLTKIRAIKQRNDSRASEFTLDLRNLDLDDDVILLLSEELIKYSEMFEDNLDKHPFKPIRILELSNNPRISDRGLDAIISWTRLTPWLDDVKIVNLPSVSSEVQRELNSALKEIPYYDKSKLLSVRKIMKEHGGFVSGLYNNWALIRIWSPEIIKKVSTIKNILRNRKIEGSLVLQEDPEFTTSYPSLALSGRFAGQWGHVSLQTLQEYISLWPAETPSSLDERVPSFFNSKEDDFRCEENKVANCIIVLHLLDARKIEKKYAELTCKYTLVNRKKLSRADETELAHNCSSIIISLLKEGIISIDQLLRDTVLRSCDVAILNEEILDKLKFLQKNIIKKIEDLEKTTVSPNAVAHLVTEVKELELLFLKLIGFSYKQIEDFDKLPSEHFLKDELSPNLGEAQETESNVGERDSPLLTFMHQDLGRRTRTNPTSGSPDSGETARETNDSTSTFQRVSEKSRRYCQLV